MMSHASARVRSGAGAGPSGRCASAAVGGARSAAQTRTQPPRRSGPQASACVHAGGLVALPALAPRPQWPAHPGSPPPRPAALAVRASPAPGAAAGATPLPQQQPGAGGPTPPPGAPPPVRRIILLRHAESEASDAGARDYERPISSGGREQAAAIAKRLRDLGWAPDLIIASNSRRTKMTLDVMAAADEQLGSVDAHYLGSLYTVAALDGQTRGHLEEVIRGVANDTANFCVMCVGHNKGWEEAASSFARQAVRLSTASAALFEAAARSWQDATSPEVEWRLVQVVTP